MYKLIVTPGNNSGLVKKVLLARGNWESVSETDDLENQLPKANFVWTPVSLPLRYYQITDQSSRNQNKTIILNHFENHRIITTKVNLIRTLRNYYNHEQNAYRANYNVFCTTPTTFILSVGNEDKEYYEFIHRYGELEKGSFVREKVPAKHCKENMWLVKPANLNQGRGIEIFRSLKQILSFLGSKPLNSLWVVQKYIEKPLLYYGRKFDIRVWVIVTGGNEIYFYRKGYIRTSSDEYSLDKSNNYVHLTNNCLQKFGSGYSKFEEGNTLPLETLQQYINGLDIYAGLGFDLQRDIVARIKDIIIDAIVAGRKAFTGRRREFELFGYDFLVDEDLRTWLIEVNTNPYLGVPNDYIKDLLNRMLDDMLKLVIDPVFPPKNKDIFSTGNDFELLYSEDPFKTTRSLFTKQVYPIESLAQAPNRRKNEQTQIQSEKKVFKEYNVDDHIRQMLESHMYGDFEPFFKPVGRLLSEIMNWELDSEQNHTSHTKTLKLLQESKFVGVLAHDKFLPMIVKVIDSQSFPTDIQTVVIQCVVTMSKSVETKVKVATAQMINALVKVGLAMFDQKEYKQFDKGLIKACIKSLMALAGVNSLKYFIPGETRESKAIRDMFIKYGGLTILLLAAQEQDYKQEINHFLGNISLADWENQLNVLKQKQGLMQKSKSKQGGEKSALEIHQNALISTVQNHIQEEKDQIIRREKDLKERRERYEQEQQKMKEQKEKIDRQRKLITEDYIRRKNTERLKLKEEEDKKLTEIRLQEQQRKRRFAEEILRRRQQLKVVRNDSHLKLNREREKQKEREHVDKRDKYTSQERQRIWSEWLENKRQQSRVKRQTMREQQIMKTRRDQQRKSQIHQRIIKLQLKVKDRQRQKDMEKIGQAKNLLPIHVIDQTDRKFKRKSRHVSQYDQTQMQIKSKSRLPKVPKSPARCHPYSLNHSQDEADTRNDKRAKLDENVGQAVKCFMNVIRRAVRTKRKDMIDPRQASGEHMVNQCSSELAGKRWSEGKDDCHFVRTEQIEDKKDRTRAVIDFILSSPYSNFIRKNNKFKHAVGEVE